MSKAIRPPDQVTRELFREWQFARRGVVTAERLSNPVWEWLARERLDPFFANDHFKTTDSYPPQPRWAGCRMGQAELVLRDGRTILIAGEHEDYYDPDFYIYNDIIVRHEDGRMDIFGYPEEVFPPTDFHTATPIQNDSEAIVIGNLGYPDDRQIGSTQVLSVDLGTFSVTRLETTGDNPGWIYDHSAELDDSREMITISGGKLVADEGIIENIDEWGLDLRRRRWVRLSDKAWPRLIIERDDSASFSNLWHYTASEDEGVLAYFGHTPRDSNVSRDESLARLETYKLIFRPPVPHELIARGSNSPEDDDRFDDHRFLVNSVAVRIHCDMSEIKLTAEGDLELGILETIADHICEAAGKIEECGCRTRWIHPRRE